MALSPRLKEFLWEVVDAYREQGLEAARKAAERHHYGLREKRENGRVLLLLEDKAGGDVKELIKLELYDDGRVYYEISRVPVWSLTPGRWRYSPTGKTSYYYARW